MIDIVEQNWRGFAVVGCIVGVAVTALVIWLILKSSRGTSNAMLSMVLNKMTQGVVMFDSDERLVVCNERISICTDYRATS